MPTSRLRDVTKKIGVVIGKRRQALSLSQEEVVVRAKISRSYYSDIERGLRNISVHSLCSIAYALGTSGYELLKEAEDDGKASG